MLKRTEKGARVRQQNVHSNHNIYATNMYCCKSPFCLPIQLHPRLQHRVAYPAAAGGVRTENVFFFFNPAKVQKTRLLDFLFANCSFWHLCFLVKNSAHFFTRYSKLRTSNWVIPWLVELLYYRDAAKDGSHSTESRNP